MPRTRDERVARGFALDPEVGATGPTGPTGATGATGPAGADGADGDSGGFYTHTQVSVSADWAVTHNLGYRPAVRALDSGDTQQEGDVEDIDDNSLIIHFTSAFSGVAYLS